MVLLLDALGPVEQWQIVRPRHDLSVRTIRPCEVEIQRSSWLSPARMGHGFPARLPPVLGFRHGSSLWLAASAYPAEPISRSRQGWASFQSATIWSVTSFA